MDKVKEMHYTIHVPAIVDISATKVCKSELAQIIMLTLVLLQWQEFATGSVAVFFYMPPRCRWQISIGVKARVVNQKQVNVAASIVPAVLECANCSQHTMVGVH